MKNIPTLTLHRNALSFKLIVRGGIASEACQAINVCKNLAILMQAIDAPYRWRLWRKGLMPCLIDFRSSNFFLKAAQVKMFLGGLHE
jgi:hypothetical protein